MATTKMIAGLMGPTLLAMGIAMLVNARHFPEMAKQIGNDPGLIFVSGILLLVAGLAIVRVHRDFAHVAAFLGREHRFQFGTKQHSSHHRRARSVARRRLSYLQSVHHRLSSTLPMPIAGKVTETHPK